MFNDSLTHEQCIRLVDQLSETVFPFQCAHGRYVTFSTPLGSLFFDLAGIRPSMVPLANLGKLSGNSGGTARRPIHWSTLEEQSLLE